MNSASFGRLSGSDEGPVLLRTSFNALSREPSPVEPPVELRTAAYAARVLSMSSPTRSTASSSSSAALASRAVSPARLANASTHNPLVTTDSNRNYRNLMQKLNLLAPVDSSFTFKMIECASSCTFYNQKKSRYPDNLPTDKFRIKLVGRTGVDADYINASSYKGMAITQGPMENTQEEFWLMIFQQDVTNIACLAAHLEPSLKKAGQFDEKTYPYWNPELRKPASERIVLQEGSTIYLNAESGLEVKLVAAPVIAIPQTHGSQQYVVRQKFAISFRGQTKTVEHLHFIDWADHSDCDPATLLNLAKLIRSTGKTAIHCSAGLGRSGTLAVLLHCMEKYSQTKKEPTEAEVIQEAVFLREARPGSIVNDKQLALLFKALVMFIREQKAAAH